MTLIFDTETTGKADFKKAPEEPCQPRLVQLGAILFDPVWDEVATINLIIKPESYEIPPEASAIHGITQEKALRYGVGEKAALHLFAALMNRAHILVAHNMAFDGLVMGRAYYVHGVDNRRPKNVICTMNAMTNICQLAGNYGKYKWPKLTEAITHIGGTPHKAHDALGDVRMCAQVYRWLLENNHLPA